MGAMQTRIIAVVVVAIVLIGGGAFVLHSKNSNNSNQAATSASPSTNPQANSASQTLKDLLTSGENKTCTFDYQGTNGETRGIFYVSGDKVRGDLNTNTNGKVQGTHIIRIGDENYIWGSSLPTGMKMKLSIDEFSKSAQTSQAFDPNQKTNFNCVPWTVDASLFTPPSDIKFTDAGTITAPSGAPHTSPGAAMIQSQCAACAALTGDNKTACLSIYHCQ